MKRFIHFFSALVLITSSTDSYINEKEGSLEGITNNSPNIITISIDKMFISCEF